VSSGPGTLRLRAPRARPRRSETSAAGTAVDHQRLDHVAPAGRSGSRSGATVTSPPRRPLRPAPGLHQTRSPTVHATGSREIARPADPAEKENGSATKGNLPRRADHRHPVERRAERGGGRAGPGRSPPGSPGLRPATTNARRTCQRVVVDGRRSGWRGPRYTFGLDHRDPAGTSLELSRILHRPPRFGPLA